MAVARPERPFPPGDYDVVVIGSGPGGLQTSYCLSRVGIAHAVVSADDGPGGMFRHFPLFERLISWTHGSADVPHETREFEAHDQNSLIADEPELRSLVAREMAEDANVEVVPVRAAPEQVLRRVGVRLAFPGRIDARVGEL